MFTQKINFMQIQNLMIPLDKFPVIKSDMILKEALEEMNNKKLGIACVVDNEMKLCGILTDGDIRRKLLSIQKPLSSILIDDCIDHAILTPTTISISDSLISAINLMEEKNIWDLPVINEGKLRGLLHLHPIVKALLNNDKISLI